MKLPVVSLARALPDETQALGDIEAVNARHGRFMWATLYRLGVAQADLPDALQDVLVVVHRRRHTLDPSCRPTTWLFGICAKVALAYRRRAHVRREELGGGQEPVDHRSPEEVLLRRAGEERLLEVLDGIKPQYRAVFVMFEIEERSCQEIAAELDIPVGTVHSRLHAARAKFRASLARLEARERRDEARSRKRGAP
jgi:RNA polymerase sigma-70 factor (ECF subfamily)